MVSASPTGSFQDRPLPNHGCWIVGFDGSDDSRRALDWACGAAKGSGARIELWSAWQYPYFGAAPLTGSAIPALGPEMEVRILDGTRRAAQEYTKRSGTLVEAQIQVGTATQVLIDAVEHADLAVVGRRGRGGFARLVLGSVSHQLACHSHRPTLIIPESARDGGIARVVVGVDGSANSHAALRWATEFAPQAEIAAVMAWEIPSKLTVEGLDPTHLQRLEADAQREFDLLIDEVDSTLDGAGSITREFVVGNPRHVLMTAAEQASLLAVGARGKGGAMGLVLGSVSTSAAHHSACPVAIVPSEYIEWGQGTG